MVHETTGEKDMKTKHEIGLEAAYTAVDKLWHNAFILRLNTACETQTKGTPYDK
jgi:hypothetical protein